MKQKPEDWVLECQVCGPLTTFDAWGMKNLAQLHADLHGAYKAEHHGCFGRKANYKFTLNLATMQSKWELDEEFFDETEASPQGDVSL